LRDQVLTMASPSQLGEQLDDLLTGVDAIQATAKDHQDLFGGGVTPISEISSLEDTLPPVRERMRG
jgi:hypothetical protein